MAEQMLSLKTKSIYMTQSNRKETDAQTEWRMIHVEGKNEGGRKEQHTLMHSSCK